MKHYYLGIFVEQKTDDVRCAKQQMALRTF